MRNLFLALAIALGLTPAAYAAPEIASSEYVYCGGSAPARVKFSYFDEGSTGANTVLAAVSGKKIRVLAYFIQGLAQVDYKWRSGTTDITPYNRLGTASLPSLSGFTINCAPFGCFETAAGELLDLYLAGAVSVRGHITYVECE